jgi:hypothetical protein
MAANTTNNSAFFSAVMAGEFDTARAVQGQGKVNIRSDNSTLCWASKEGHLPIVQFLLGAGSDVHARNDFPLALASANGHLPIVQLLVEHGADIRAQNSLALREAARNAHTSVFEFLSQKTATTKTATQTSVADEEVAAHTRILESVLSRVEELASRLDDLVIDDSAEKWLWAGSVLLASREKTIRRFWEEEAFKPAHFLFHGKCAPICEIVRKFEAAMGRLVAHRTKWLPLIPVASSAAEATIAAAAAKKWYTAGTADWDKYSRAEKDAKAAGILSCFHFSEQPPSRPAILNWYLLVHPLDAGGVDARPTPTEGAEPTDVAVTSALCVDPWGYRWPSRLYRALACGPCMPSLRVLCASPCLPLPDMLILVARYDFRRGRGSRGGCELKETQRLRLVGNPTVGQLRMALEGFLDTSANNVAFSIAPFVRQCDVPQFMQYSVEYGTQPLEVFDCRSARRAIGYGVIFVGNRFDYHYMGATDIGVWVGGDSDNGALLVPGADWLKADTLPAIAPTEVASAAIAAGGRVAATFHASNDAVVSNAGCIKLAHIVDNAWGREWEPATVAVAAVDAAVLPFPCAFELSVLTGSSAEDFKELLTVAQLKDAIGPAAVSALVAELGAPPDCIVLRRTLADGRWINLHTDAAMRTVCVPLSSRSDECSRGGSFVVATTDGQLNLVHRRPGYAYSHDGDLAHGVTKFTQGTRRCLFLLRSRKPLSSGDE